MNILYSRATCAPCKSLKTYLKNKQIEYQEIDLDQSPEAEKEVFSLTGMIIVPVFQTPKGCMSGLNIGKLITII